jgi:Outer membrane lipoprotein-sorting protein
MKFFQLSAATEWRPKIAHGETVGFDSNINQAPAGAKEMVRGLIFCRPCRGSIRSVVLPTVSPWATFFRASGALAALILFFAVGAMAETTNTLSDAEIQGRNLAQQLCESKPTENLTNSGILQIRNSKGETIKVPVDCFVFVTQTNWINFYMSSRFEGSVHSESTGYTDSMTSKFPIEITHFQSRSSIYKFTFPSPEQPSLITDLYAPFAGSDFWLCDLGLEFFHWPQQKVLPKTTPLRRGREYTLLESMNPNPSTNGYSRVLSWIDKESGGILEAEAYDFNGKLLKDFAPKSFKKVDGQWQLQEMEIRNVQTGSRTKLEFDLNKP